MNERINELISQCIDQRWTVTGPLFDREKFAELIVKECIEQCSKALVEYTGQPSVTHNYAVGLCQDSIEKHFGVEQ